MARTSVAVTGSTLAAFITNLNTVLAALTNPIIRGLTVQVVRAQRRAGLELSGLLTYDTGGSSLGTPFLAVGYEENNFPQLLTDLNTYYGGTGASYFIAAPIFNLFDTDTTQNKLALYLAILLVNSTSGASANFLPLVVG